jgi:hypothetical protein
MPLQGVTIEKTKTWISALLLWREIPFNPINSLQSERITMLRTVRDVTELQ